MQTYIVISIVALAAGYMLLRLLRRLGVLKGASGCGCGCEGCGPVSLPVAQSRGSCEPAEGVCAGCAPGQGCCLAGGGPAGTSGAPCGFAAKKG